MTSIYYVRDDEDFENNRDLFVEADNAGEAIILWRGYYGLDHTENPVGVYCIPHRDGRSRTLDWNDFDGVMLAWPQNMC